MLSVTALDRAVIFWLVGYLDSATFGTKAAFQVTRSVSEGNAETSCLAYASGYAWDAQVALSNYEAGVIRIAVVKKIGRQPSCLLECL